VANLESFRSVLAQNPRGLHFSGHGSGKTIEGGFYKESSIENSLLFEHLDGTGEGELISEKKLSKEIL